MTAGLANPGRGCADAGRSASQPSEWAPAPPRGDEGLGLQDSPVTLGRSTLCFCQRKSAERFALFPSFCVSYKGTLVVSS